MDETDDKEFAKTLAKGLMVLEAFDRENPGYTVAEIAKRFGYNRAVARRILRTLEILGYVRQDRREYRLAPRVLRLGYGYLASNRVGNLIHPILKQVTDEIDEPCSMGVLDGDEVVYIAHSPGEQRYFSVGLTVGSRLPLLTTAIGRALVAFLPENQRLELVRTAPVTALTARTVIDRERLAAIVEDVRRAGYAFVDNEVEIGLTSVGVPVFAPDGVVAGAINIVVNNGRVDETRLRGDYVTCLKRCAARLEAALG